MPHEDETVALPSSSPSAPARSRSANRFEPGQLLAARYRIVALLGKGGMGEVYRADDLTLGQSVALKFLPPGAATDRFRNEVRIARQVSHPNVCRVYDLGEVDGQMFLSMEYVDGEDLGSLLRRIGRLPADKAIEIARKLCAGLAAAHQKGVLHRDLKPGNVMLDARGQVLLTDFGLAALSGEVEGAEILSGTPQYMSPEQLQGREVTTRSDIYSLGLLMYEVFTGKKPYESDTLAGLMEARERSTPASMTSLVRDLDPLVERVILRCLERDPAKRPASAISVAAALPGGDPLAAALAAGETPSPQMVAAAGEGRGLKAKYALPLLAVTIVAIVGHALTLSSRSALQAMKPEYSRDVLRVKARDIAAQLGYTARPADFESRFDWNSGYIGWLQKNEKPEVWNRALNEGPTGLRFWYRESAVPMTGVEFHSDLLIPGIITEDDPAQTRSGMIDIQLDHRGKLQYFVAIPPQFEPNPAPAQPADWAPLFNAAGLDLSKFSETSSQWNFLTPADERKAWTGTWPGTARPVRVEAAAWHGKAVAFHVLGAWMKPWRQPSSDSGNPVQTWVPLGIIGLMLGGGAVAARRNVILGKGDRKGAMRLATIVFAVSMTLWACQVHLTGSIPLIGMFLIAVATSIGWAAVLWMLYLALEPFVRRHWPQAIISWSSITVGNWRDPIVGRDVLAGIALGMSWRLFDRAIELWGPPLINDALHLMPLDGLRATAGEWVRKLYLGIRSALMFVFLLFLFRLALRKQWLAAPVFVIVFSLLASLGNEPFWLNLAVNLAVYAIIAVAAVRLGFVCLVAAIFAANGTFLTGALQGGWYFGASLFGLLLLIAVASWGCWIAMEGKKLWTSEPAG